MRWVRLNRKWLYQLQNRLSRGTHLIVYSTTDGQTLRICQCLQEVVQQGGHQVTLVDIVQAGACDLQRYDTIVIGASIHYGKHAPIVLDFVKRHCTLLGNKPSAFFSVNVVARKPNKNTPATNPYLQKFLRQIAWRPDRLAASRARSTIQSTVRWTAWQSA